MLAIPAIDLREGHVVQLVGGEYDREQVRLDDPRRIARQWALASCRAWSHEADDKPDGGKAYAVARLLKGVADAIAASGFAGKNLLLLGLVFLGLSFLLMLGLVMLYSSSMTQVGPRYLVMQLIWCASKSARRWW